MFSRLIKSKTFWTGVATIIGSWGAYFTGDLALQAAISASVTALLAIFLRDGMAKNQ